MPWDGSDLWIADLSSDGQLGDVRHVAGGPAESIMQPEWTADGSLLFVSDRTGWWNLYRYHPEVAASRGSAGHVEPLLPLEAEFVDPPWELEQRIGVTGEAGVQLGLERVKPRKGGWHRHNRAASSIRASTGKLSCATAVRWQRRRQPSVLVAWSSRGVAWCFAGRKPRCGAGVGLW